ncbi:MAG: hypothetical protein HYS67_10130 [Deltaproteobacteria bacterium]|nr:hypothetical protein [Deltaproteobacteria bacterium]
MPPRDGLSPSRTRLGWIGTGVMGLSMAGHLIDQGYAITVYNRTQAKAHPLRFALSSEGRARTKRVNFTKIFFLKSIASTGRHRQGDD